MRTQIVLLISLYIAFTGCMGKPDPDKKINLIENHDIKLRDTAFEKYYNNKLFSPHIVRLDNNSKPAFILIDSSYFNTKSLTPADREVYYKKVLALLPKDDLAAHRLVWNIPEVRAMQQGTGGNGTIVSAIKEKMDSKSGYYLVELKRNDVENFSQVYGISLFRVRLRPFSMEIGDESGYFVSMEMWRRAQK